MAGIYNIDWSNVGRNLLFWRWRRNDTDTQSVLMSYINSIMASVQVLSNKLDTLDDETDDFLQYTGQHKILEEFLNNKYDEVQRRLFITENDIAQLDPLVVGLSDDSVSQPVIIGITGDTVAVPIALGLSNELVLADNFTVNIPTAVLYTEATLRAQLSNYVLAGKTYNIVTF